MIDPNDAEKDRGRVVVIATLAVAAIFLLSQVAYPPAPTIIPRPNADPVDGISKSKPRLPRLRRLNPFHKREYEHAGPEAPEVSAPGP